ncbi:MAG: hypothetical protein ABII82_18960 [Verrucomicrobiota bacterium]
MILSRHIPNLALSLVALAAAVVASARPIPSAPSGNPGNVFLQGDSVRLPVVGDKAGAWEVLDLDDGRVASGRLGRDGVDLGKLPVGHYRLFIDGAPAATAAVLAPLRAAVPAGSPVNAKTWFAGHYILGRIDSIEDAMSLVALAGVSGVCDATAWTWHQDESGEWREPGARHADSFGLVVEATRRTGLELLIDIEPGTPDHAALPPDWGPRPRAKFPADLRDYARFVRHIVKLGGDDVAAWEAWNEPEGIGGHHLGSEIASAMKVFALAARSVRPDAHVAMGMGHVPAESLARNGYLDAIDSYHYHAHRSAEAIARRRASLEGFTGDRPVWNTEASYGAYALRPGSAELTPEAEREQARDIPKLFARSLHEGNERIYYFTPFQVAETAGQQWGLLRAGTLQPRTGYLALAATGRLLAGAKPAGRLTNLPGGVVGWSFSARPDGEEKTVLVLWSEEGDSAAMNWPAEARLFDLWGRELPPAARPAVGKDPIWCVLPAQVAAGLRRDPPPVREGLARPDPAALCPVVADFRRPERLKNHAGNFFLLTSPAPELDIDVYNLSADTLDGAWRAEAPEGFAAEVIERPGALAADGRGSLRVRLTPLASWQSGEGDQVRWLRVVGDYGDRGQSVLAIPFVHIPSDARPLVSTMVGGAVDPDAWRIHAAGGTTVRLGAEGGRVRFDVALGAAPNITIGLSWAAPVYALPESERPSAGAWGVGLRAAGLDASPGTTVALNLVKRNGAVWTCPLPYGGREIATKEGERFLLPLSWFAHIGHRAPDPDGRLDASDIVGFELAVTGRPGTTFNLELTEVFWASGDVR